MIVNIREIWINITQKKEMIQTREHVERVFEEDLHVENQHHNPYKSVRSSFRFLVLLRRMIHRMNKRL